MTEDERYRHLVGKTVTLPLTGRKIPIIADGYVDPEFGTGCVKITPAHDFNDYAVGLRHSLPMINVLTPDARLNEAAPADLRGLDGKDVKLSELRGKVVVLDIWATWCPYCRAMIPHERQLVERLKDKPFALVSISMDARKEALTDFLAKENMPWLQWWVGANSNLAEDWNIEYFPTVYVVDARGVIRNEGVTGDDLEKAVSKLLNEMEKKR